MFATKQMLGVFTNAVQKTIVKLIYLSDKDSGKYVESCGNEQFSLYEKLKLILFSVKQKTFSAIRICTNELRRGFVNRVLGNNITLVINRNENGTYVEFIDIQKRLTYGKWSADQVNDHEFKLSR